MHWSRRRSVITSPATRRVAAPASAVKPIHAVISRLITARRLGHQSVSARRRSSRCPLLLVWAITALSSVGAKMPFGRWLTQIILDVTARYTLPATRKLHQAIRAGSNYFKLFHLSRLHISTLFTSCIAVYVPYTSVTVSVSIESKTSFFGWLLTLRKRLGLEL